jgi:hypothetical protein
MSIKISDNFLKNKAKESSKMRENLSEFSLAFQILSIIHCSNANCKKLADFIDCIINLHQPISITNPSS